MNKEFKFWCLGTSENVNFNEKGWWTYPNFLLSKYFGNLDIFDSPDFVTCQYTELLDKNGVKIFEGDIIRAYSSEYLNENFIGKVIFDEGEYLTWVNGGDIRGLCGGDDIEVIGNIFENPDIKNRVFL